MPAPMLPVVMSPKMAAQGHTSAGQSSISLSAKTYEESVRISSFRANQREKLKQQMLIADEKLLENQLAAWRERDVKWKGKLQGSPLAVDLALEGDQHEVRLRRTLRKERRSNEEARREQQKRYGMAFKHAAAEKTEEEEMAELIAERKALLEHQHQLKILADVRRRTFTGHICRDMKSLQSLPNLQRPPGMKVQRQSQPTSRGLSSSTGSLPPGGGASLRHPSQDLSSNDPAAAVAEIQP